MRVLLIEDDPSIRQFVSRGLKEESHVVDVATDGEEGLFLALSKDYDAVVLDLMLPKRDGGEVLREMRARGTETPVIALTARDAVSDKVRLLDDGVDDYMTKPFSLSELSARLRALSRRARSAAQNTVTVGDLEIDPVTRSVRRAGRPIELTAKEFSLLFFLAQHEGRVLTRRIIAEHVWDEQFQSFSNVIDVHLNRLRKKIDQGFGPRLLHTIRGVGYVLRVED